MTEQNKSDQTPTSQTEDKPTAGQQTGQQPDQQKGTPSETGATKDAETLTQTEQPAAETGEQTGETEGGFVASKKEDESGYLQGERKGGSDIEGSSIKKDDQTS